MEKRRFRVLLCLFLGLAVMFAGCSSWGFTTIISAFFSVRNKRTPLQGVDKKGANLTHQSILPFLLTNLPEQYIIIL